MKPSHLLCALLACAAPALVVPACAQPDAIKPANGLPFPLVAPSQAEKLTAAAPLAIHLQNVTLRAALEELQKQSGVELDLARNGSKEAQETLDKTMSIDVDTPSFYRAFNEILDEAGVKASLQRYETNRPWSVAINQPDSTKNAPQSVQGLFEMRLLRLSTTLSKTVNLGRTDKYAHSDQNTLDVSVLLRPDLRLPLLGVPRARVTRADDDQGRSLLVKPSDNAQRDEWRNNSYSFYNDSYQQSQSNLRLSPPAPDAKTLAHLEGVMVYALLTKTENWEVPDLLAQPEWTHSFASGDQKFEMTIKPTFKAGKTLSLNIEVSTNGAVIQGQVSPPMMAAGPVLAGLKIVDANGQVLRSSGYGGGSGEQKLTINPTFYPANRYNRGGDDGDQKPKPLAAPFKFSFDAPLGVVQTEVPFAFEDVPLP